MMIMSTLYKDMAHHNTISNTATHVHPHKQTHTQTHTHTHTHTIATLFFFLSPTTPPS